MAKKDNKANKNVKENNKNKKSFFKGFKAELKKVTWPTPKQLVNNTVAVITIVLLLTLIVFVLDFAFEQMNKYGVDKLKEVISTTNSTTENTSSDNTTTEGTTDNTTDDNVTANETQESSENTAEGTNTENATETQNENNQSAENTAQ